MSFLSKILISTPVNGISALLGLPAGAAPSALNFLLYSGEAVAPTLYEYDANGFVQATPGGSMPFRVELDASIRPEAGVMATR